MARAKFGQIVSEMRGKVNGLVFSRGNCGSVIRVKTSNTNRRTLKQSEQRSHFSFVTQAWKTLTTAQRKAWNEQSYNYTRINVFGNKEVTTGFDYFCYCNMNLLKINESIILWPQKSPVNFSFTSFTYTLDYTGQTINLNFFPVIPTGKKLMIFATCPHSVGITNVKNLWRKIMVIDNSYPSPTDCFPEYSSVFGGMGYEGQNILFKGVLVDSETGFSSSNINIDKLDVIPTFIIGDDTVHPPLSIGYYNRIRLFPVTASNDGVIQKYFMYAGDDSGSGTYKLKCALYDNSFNLVANSVSDEIIIPVVHQWNELVISGAKPTINNGVDYWLAGWSNGVQVYNNGIILGSGIQHRYKDYVYTGVFPVNISSPFSSAILSPSYYGLCYF